jgi:3-oxoacyl-[acyl-carrier protein] reductase
MKGTARDLLRVVLVGVPVALGRMCDPEDVANVAVFLGSPQARFLTGVEMPVDGGRSI